MKAVHIVLFLLLAAAAPAAYFLFKPVAPPECETPAPLAAPVDQESVPPETVTTISESNLTVVAADEPVVPLEERGDAMLFEIDALQNSPFDDAILRPFD